MINEQTAISGTICMLDKVDFGSRYVSPRAKVSLSLNETVIVAEERKRSKVQFYNHRTNELIFYSSPPSIKEEGLLGWLKFVHFFKDDSKIAEIRYKGWLSEPQLTVKDVHIPIEKVKIDRGYIYTNEYFDIVFEGGKDTQFTVIDTEYLYPCIGFVHYYWSSKWSG